MAVRSTNLLHHGPGIVLADDFDELGDHLARLTRAGITWLHLWHKPSQNIQGQSPGITADGRIIYQLPPAQPGVKAARTSRSGNSRRSPAGPGRSTSSTYLLAARSSGLTGRSQLSARAGRPTPVTSRAQSFSRPPERSVRSIQASRRWATRRCGDRERLPSRSLRPPARRSCSVRTGDASSCPAADPGKIEVAGPLSPGFTIEQAAWLTKAARM